VSRLFACWHPAMQTAERAKAAGAPDPNVNIPTRTPPAAHDKTQLSLNVLALSRQICRAVQQGSLKLLIGCVMKNKSWLKLKDKQ